MSKYSNDILTKENFENLLVYELYQVAEYAGKLEQYEKAIGIYEKVAGDALDSSLLKYSAKV